LEIKLLSSISECSALDWNSLAGDAYPFMQWQFLKALEESGAVGEQTAWQVQHVLVFEQDTLIALMPMYLKGNSQGEYVFDHSWANAYARHGLNYFPKLVTSIPFTPCEGPRLCFHGSLSDFGFREEHVFEKILETIKALAELHQISSWHCLFPESKAIVNFKSDQLLLREGVQFQWFNKAYKSFDDYLASFTSKRRKNLKRERKKVTEQGITITRLTGEEISEELWRIFFKFYQATYWKRGMSEYLNLDFFLRLAKSMPEKILLVIAEKDGNILAGALSLIGKDTLYGRYWGCLDEYYNLHFELCYYQGLEFCIENNLQCFNSGAQGEHKIARGFEPVITYSLHWIAHQGFREAIADFLKEESEHIQSYKNAAGELLPFKQIEKIELN
jgi:predicted N-acyltransferase